MSKSVVLIGCSTDSSRCSFSKKENETVEANYFSLKSCPVDWVHLTALVAFLHKANYFPKRIVFIDDRLHHVQDLESVVTDMGIEFIGIRFSGADARVKAFDSSIAELQWGHLPEIISDQEASNQLYFNHTHSAAMHYF